MQQKREVFAHCSLSGLKDVYSLWSNTINNNSNIKLFNNKLLTAAKLLVGIDK